MLVTPKKDTEPRELAHDAGVDGQLTDGVAVV